MSAESLPDLRLIVSVSPHLRDPESTSHIMWSVGIALLPAGIWAVWLFGFSALWVMALSVAACMATEALIQRMRGLPITLSDGSAFVTGLLLAYVLPAQCVVASAGGSTRLAPLPWFIPIIGGVAAIGIAKHCFGGLGCNIWNPALVGRAVVQLSFPEISPKLWPWPAGSVVWETADAVTRATNAVSGATAHASTAALDGVTAATSLTKDAGVIYSVKHLFFGYCPGSMGEVSAFLLILGALYLIARRYVNWRLPLAYLVMVAVAATLFAWGAHERSPAWTAEFTRQFAAWRHGNAEGSQFFLQWLAYAGRQLFSGGVILGAFFMATDMVTSPLTNWGQFLFGIGCGLLTVVIRFLSPMPEGVCYAILLMNTVRPYIDRMTRQRVMGQVRA